MKSKEKTPRRGSQEAQVLGQMVRQLRLSRQMTQTALAEEADLDPKYIGLVEAGRTNISLLNLLKLSFGLALPPGELLGAAFPTNEHAALSSSLLQELLGLLRENDLATLELLRSLLAHIKNWEATRRGTF